MSDSEDITRERPTRRAARQKSTAPRRPARGSSSRRSARLRGCLLAVVFIVLVAAGAAGAVWWTLYRAESDIPAGRPVTVEVAKGATTGDIGRLLASKGVVQNSTMFGMKAQESGAAGGLKPGEYEFTTGSDYQPVIAALSKGPTIVYSTVTIPEGWTIDQVAKRVEEKTGVPASEFATIAKTGAKKFDFAFLSSNPSDSLQGYLFPKTYRVREGSSAEDVVRLMLAQYGKETADIDYSFATSKKLTERDVLIIASIIEREASRDKDRPLVASVVYNRLKKKMRLEMCSTVQFVLGGKPRLTIKDTRIESPYNTYLHTGLPPGPICGPGLASLKAAAAPATTSYLYYVLTRKDGSHSFSASYDEFLRQKARAARGLQ